MAIKSFGGGGGGAATRVIQVHDETISGGATWHWPLADDAGVESVTGGSPVDMTGTNFFHPLDPAGYGGSLDASRSAAISGAIGAPVNIYGAITVAAWIRRSASQASNTVICGTRTTGGTSASNSSWELSMETNDKIRVVWHAGAHVAQTSITTTATVLDTWEHWCFTRPTAGTSCKIFKNGVIDGTEFTGLTIADDGSGVDEVSIGQQGTGGAKFQGDIYSAIVYSEELTPTQVLALYNSTSSTGSWA